MNIDAVATAGHLGISSDRAANYIADREGLRLHFEAMNEALSNFRSNFMLDSDWKKKINADFEMRGKSQDIDVTRQA